MDVLSFWIIGLLAIIASGMSMSSRTDIDPLMTGTFSLVMWVMFAFSAYSVELSVGGGTSVTHSYPALALHLGTHHLHLPMRIDIHNLHRDQRTIAVSCFYEC